MVEQVEVERSHRECPVLYLGEATLELLNGKSPYNAYLPGFGETSEGKMAVIEAQIASYQTSVDIP